MHYNLCNPEPILQEPVKAIASRKMHYFTRLEAIIDAAAPGAPELKSNQRFPNLQYAGGLHVLDDEAKR